MRVVLSWLRELCPVRATPEELAELLTARGAKVEAILRPWESLSGVLVARVVEVSDHPNSDKLCLARVTFGSGERVLVVGVRNMAPGDLVPLAGPGASVPALAQPLAAREIRGVVSEGMLCSPYELGIAQDHSGILLLPEDTEPGDDVKEALGLDEAVFDIEVTPNRPDLMSVVGVAREASAATGVPLESPQSDLREEAETAASAAGIEIRDRERCPRYLARVIRGVSHGPSPVRKRARLTAAGMRPISAIVDATNYAMLEFGHPMHAFDLDLLEGAAIVVRRAEEGEELTTLDGVGRKLSGDDLLIADSASGLAVAGVMGGTRAEVSDETRDVLLESAYFQPGGVLRTSRRLGLSSEASMRFERGTDPEALAPAADRACALLSEWAGGRILAGRLDEGETPVRRRVSMRVPRAAALLGHPVSQADAVGSLEKLGFEVDTDDDQVTVEVPGFRVDIEREVDLIEEVARVQGYELIGSTMPPVRQAGGLPGSYAFVGRVRRSLVRAGLREVRLIPFTSERDLAMFGDGSAVRVANPLDAEQAFLRTRLAPGLVAAVGRNLARNSRSVALFEVGTVFRLSDPLHEGRKVGAVMAGSSPSWGNP